MKISKPQLLALVAGILLIGVAAVVNSSGQESSFQISAAEEEANRKAAALAAASWTPEKVKIFADENRKARATKNSD